MIPAFRKLRETFRPIPRKAAKRSIGHLRKWMTEHADDLAKIKPDAEFNGTMMQAFHWYLPNDGKHWVRLKEEAPGLAAAGFTALWLPPATKGAGGTDDVGYGVYDLFDLGEFPIVKDGVASSETRTKYGTRDELVGLADVCRRLRMQVYADVVFNHKIGADYEETFQAIPCDPQDRNRPLGDSREIRSWTGYDFKGRGDAHSTMKWHWWHFGSIDYNSTEPGFKAVWRIKPFNDEVDRELGNYDYLMGCDIDVDHDEVRGELKYWGEWLMGTMPVDGFRLDAIKHIEGDFFNDWLDHLERTSQRDLFCVGEYWTTNMNSLGWYLGVTGGRLNLFDAPLQNHFHQASRAGGDYDMSTILDGTLMKEFPMFAVTLVENHDTQPLQSLEAVVEAWFKPLAYAIILLRAEGYPCVFHGDYYGAEYSGRGRDGNEHYIKLISHRWIIDRLLVARVHFAHGPQYSYLDHFNTIGWTRLGTAAHPHAMAVIMSDGPAGTKWMEVAKPNADFVDITGHIPARVTANGDGWAEFRCNGGSVSVWVEWHPELEDLL